MFNQKIVPHIWLKSNVKQAAMFYSNVFGKGSRIVESINLSEMGKKEYYYISLMLWGHNFILVDGNTDSKPNNSISFIVSCSSKKEVDLLARQLVEKGKFIMPLGKYYFSERYCWLEDQYGVSWQLILTPPNTEEDPKILPALFFSGKNYGKGDTAMQFFLNTFKNSKKGALMLYDDQQPPNEKNTIAYADFRIEDMWLAVMESALKESEVYFNESIGFAINCKNQQEIDFYWDNLLANTELGKCGWLKDKFGISWIVIPENLSDLVKDDPKRVNERISKMKKIVIGELN